MMLTPRHQDIAYRMIGSEPSPGTGPWGFVHALANTIQGDLWAQRVDHVIIGGDAITALVKARAIARQARPSAPVRLAIVRDPRSEIAPIGILEDDAALIDMIETGTLPPACRPALRLEARERARFVAAQMADSVGGLARSGHARIWLETGGTQAERCREDGRIVVCLQRPAGGASPLDSIDPDAATGRLHDASRHGHRQAWRETARRLGDVTEKGGRPTAYARVLLADRITLLAGHVSGGEKTTEGGTDRTRSELGADVYALARGMPGRVADAIAAWREDLRRAAGDIAT